MITGVETIWPGDLLRGAGWTGTRAVPPLRHTRDGLGLGPRPPNVPAYANALGSKVNTGFYREKMIHA
jgi:hypothetical protein